jgi:membrane carboxypeptidase/penicillin-binding protein
MTMTRATHAAAQFGVALVTLLAFAAALQNGFTTTLTGHDIPSRGSASASTTASGA